MTTPARSAAGRRATTPALLASGALFFAAPAHAEYADVVLARLAPAAGQRPVVFPHWFHRIRYRCNVCHVDLGIRMRAGANSITMTDIIEGRFCGACHNERIAWGPERCELCHSGKPGHPPGIVGGNQTKGPGPW